MSVSKRTALDDQLATRLSSLSGALNLDAGLIHATYRDLVAPWIGEPQGDARRWRSEISDDHSPIELSVALEQDDAQLRILFEPAPAQPTVDAARSAGCALHDAMESRHGVDLSRLRRVESLFLPVPMHGRFAVWTSIVFGRGEPPKFKAYLNPQAQGAAFAPALVEEALERLGLQESWASLCEAALRRGPVLDEVKYFALDLSDDASARVKVYVHHHAATAADLAAACAHAHNASPDAVLAFARAMRGGDAPMTARAPFTCHAFTDATAKRAQATVYIPVCAYARDDAEVERRVASYLQSGPGIDPARFQGAVRAAALRPLDAGVGLQSWVALRCGARPRLTVSLATESRRVAAPGTVPAPTVDPAAFASSDAVIAWLMQRPLAAHPLLRRISRALDGDAATRRAAAARHLHEALADVYQSSDPQEALGALVAGVAAVRLIDVEQPPDRAFEDLVAVARLVPATADAADAFARGAVHVHRMLWRALDAAYVATFGGHGHARPRDARTPLSSTP